LTRTRPVNPDCPPYFYVMMLLYREDVLSRVYTSVLLFKKTLCGFQGG
jgi:hypothetical protein